MPLEAPKHVLGKRKSGESERPTKKKKRSELPSPPPAEDENDTSDGSGQDQILLLENSILESKKNYNNIVALLSLARDRRPAGSPILAAIALTRVFIRLLTTGSLIPKSSLSEKDLSVVRWLRDRLGDVRTCLAKLLTTEGAGATAVTLAMRLLKAEGAHFHENREYVFPREFMRSIVERVLREDGAEAREVLVAEFVLQYVDVRFFAMQAIKDVADEAKVEGLEPPFEAVFSILSLIRPAPAGGAPKKEAAVADASFLVPAPSKKSHPLHSSTQQKRQVQDAWLALLGTSLTTDQRKRVLRIMVPTVAPWFTKPELLADFLTDSYDAAGSTSLLALSGVFYLITERNLDYPSFYRKLYSLLDSTILHSRHRSRFFRLLDTFLGSTHLPAALVASFIKRLARLCLTAPPSAIVFVVPWMYNIFRRHPLCTFMMHRATRGGRGRGGGRNGDGDGGDGRANAELQSQPEDCSLFEDRFDPDEPDPMETGAIDSCIWEVVQLQSHYHPNVATIARIVSEQFTKPEYRLEDFLDHSYGSLLEAEMAKEVKKPPVVEFQIPKRIFLPQDGGGADSLLVKLWEF